ncbi:unnamed protein product [Microthlaspi erraticum]|uniref:SWIM-type domain-containing protein n=1 Tax=Microthlaspi erraticum TaxID=1685480 RepID=A0A6D2LD08_9BRAS|nr:unnamed protein product [Microthlaspi erraticum]
MVHVYGAASLNQVLSPLHAEFSVLVKEALRINQNNQGCKWRVRATTIGDSPAFYIKVYEGEHSCSVTERSVRSRQATHQILGRLYKDFVGGVGPKVLPCHVAEALNKRYGVKIDYWKSYRTLKYARQLVRGTPESGYAEIPSYLYRIRRANPGTLTKLVIDKEDRFKFLFIAFGGSIHGFTFMRKVVVVDGTFLQGKYKGTLLIATTQDGNFNIFPIAFAVVDTENDESWEWFFRQLNLVIPDDEGLAIISDRHKSISKAIRKVYPHASRGVCTYHLYKNILLRFRGKDAFRLVKKAATVYRIEEFNEILEQIGTLNPRLHTYLLEDDVCKWSRVHFPGDRYNFTTSNIAESVNKAISHARSFPIVGLLDAIRSMLTRWFATRRKNAELMTTTLTREVEKRLEAKVDISRQLTVQEIDEHQFQVTGGISLHVVHLREKRCTCRRFDLDKIPCVHAIAAAEACNRLRISLSHLYFHRNYLHNAYSKTIMPRDNGFMFTIHDC